MNFVESLYVSDGVDETVKGRRYGALALSLLGTVMVKSWKGLLLALGAHAFAVYVVSKRQAQGPSVVYSTLSGMLLQKRQYITGGAPLAQNISDFGSTQKLYGKEVPKDVVTQMNIAHGAGTLLGYAASALRFV